MSAQMSAWYSEQYRTGVTHLYQARGFLLRGMTTIHSKIIGTKAHWPTIGKAVAGKKQNNVAAKTMNASTGDVTADLETWEAFENINKFDQSRMLPREKEAQVKTGTMALGRATDFEIIDKISAAATKTGTELFYDQTDNAFDLEHAEEMRVLLEIQMDQPASAEVFCGVSPRHWSNLTKFKQFSNSDYIGPDLPFLRKIQAKTWNDIHFVRWPYTYVDRSSPSSTNHDVFMFDKGSVGWANSFNVDDYWTWDNKFGRWDLRLESEGAAVVLQSNGIVTGRFSKTAKVSFN